MIRNPDQPSIAMVLEDLLKNEVLPEPLDPAHPRTDADRAAAKSALVRILTDHPERVRALCTGCGQDVPLPEAVWCTCGGAVCAACLAVEGDCACHHDAP
jgi:hypothetical protein